jgi:hypothetical protein
MASDIIKDLLLRMSPRTSAPGSPFIFYYYAGLLQIFTYYYSQILLKARFLPYTFTHYLLRNLNQDFTSSSQILQSWPTISRQFQKQSEKPAIDNLLTFANKAFYSLKAMTIRYQAALGTLALYKTAAIASKVILQSPESSDILNKRAIHAIDQAMNMDASMEAHHTL